VKIYEREIIINGKPERFVFRMWTHGEKTILTMKYGLFGENYVGGIIDALKGQQANIHIINQIIEQSKKRMNEIAPAYEKEMIIICTKEAPFPMSVENLEKLDDDDYQRIVTEVNAIIMRESDKFAILRSELTKKMAKYGTEVLKDALQTLNSVISGRVIESNLSGGQGEKR